MQFEPPAITLFVEYHQGRRPSHITKLQRELWKIADNDSTSDSEIIAVVRSLHWIKFKGDNS